MHRKKIQKKTEIVVNSTTKYGSRSKAVSVREPVFCIILCGRRMVAPQNRMCSSCYYSDHSLTPIYFNSEIQLLSSVFVQTQFHNKISFMNSTTLSTSPIECLLFIDAKKNLLFQNLYENSKIKFALFFFLRRRRHCLKTMFSSTDPCWFLWWNVVLCECESSVCFCCDRRVREREPTADVDK